MSSCVDMVAPVGITSDEPKTVAKKTNKAMLCLPLYFCLARITTGKTTNTTTELNHCCQENRSHKVVEKQ